MQRNERNELRDDDFVIGWAGRLSEIKRPLDLVRTLASVPESRLVIAGDGELRPGVEQLAAKLNVSDRLTILGYVDDMGAWYRTFDVFLLTSANEGAPVVAIEALAAGVPVVATDAGGTRTVVDDDETGFLTPIGDVRGLAERVTALRDDPALRERMSNEGRVRMRTRFSTDRMVEDVDAVYAHAMTHPHRDRKRLKRVRRSDRSPLSPTLPPNTSNGQTSTPIKIVLFSQYFPPEVGATQSRMQAFAEFLSERGHEVTVVCEFPNHPHGRIPAEYAGTIVEEDRSNP